MRPSEQFMIPYHMQLKRRFRAKRLFTCYARISSVFIVIIFRMFQKLESIFKRFTTRSASISLIEQFSITDRALDLNEFILSFQLMTSKCPANILKSLE